MKKISILILLISCISCNKNNDTATDPEIFERIDAQHSGISFINKIEETEAANYFKYMYMYIGGGTATGDFDNDGLDDIFLVSNSNESKLYKNLGDFKFEDITLQSGILKRKGFDVGAAVADVNNDGWLDIYITRGGWIQDNGAFENMLFINNGISTLKNGKQGITFTEKAKEYGLADDNRGIAATFFDYDHDGDIDLFLSNTADFETKPNSIIDLDKIPNDPKTVQQKGADKLYRNDGSNHFSDVSQKAGIVPDVGFGLSPQVGDVNNDGWMDIYVCNDFQMPDFVYINNQNGTFTDQRNKTLKHMSFNSMGADIADINNDGFMDIFSLDMNPEDYVRAKTTMGMTSQNQFELMVQKNYHYQYMHNMLQLNNGNGTFSEIANMAGVANTDWSWACLMADFNLDGYNDIFVTNGVFRDVIDRDANDEILKTLQQRGQKPSDANFLEFAKKLPQQKLNNYFFKNNGDLTFKNVSQEWTETNPTFSNGAAYADFDNDGDLDLLVSNLNDEVTILKNKSIESKLGNFLQFKIEGPQNNLRGVGTTINLYLKSGEILTRQLVTTRGFLSSVSSKLHFGLKPDMEISRSEVIWPDGTTEKLGLFKLNQMVTIKYDASKVKPYNPNGQLNEEKLFTVIPSTFKHQEKPFDDFGQQYLLPQKYSQLGPALAVGDVNADGLTDYFIGGASQQAGKLMVANKSGGWVELPQKEFELDKEAEDSDAIFFDADNDKDLDLLVLSGSSELFNTIKPTTSHRLYINDGKGNYKRDFANFPNINSVGSVVSAADFDNDGDQDIFIGSKMTPGYYPFAPTHYFLINNEGFFEDYTSAYIPQLANFGMLSDAHWNDIDNDKDLDLIVCGEWTGIEIFENNGKQLLLSEKNKSASATIGWWNKILIEDIDNDGDKDIVAGNVGLNIKYKASTESTFNIYANDFDNSGNIDPILTTYNGKIEVPVRGRMSIIQQMPSIGKKQLTYKEYASKSIQEILGDDLKNAKYFQAKEFRSGIFINDGKMNYTFQPFNPYAQTSTINSILFEDFDKDGNRDLLMVGNNYHFENETTRLDAGNGYLLKGNGKGVFACVPNNKHQFWVQGDVRKMKIIKNNGNSTVLVANNNDFLQLYSFYQ